MRFTAVLILPAASLLSLQAQESYLTPSGNAQQTVTTSGGTAGKVAKFAGTHAIVNSAIFESGGKVGIGTNAPSSTLTVDGVIQTTSGGIEFPDGTTQSS